LVSNSGSRGSAQKTRAWQVRPLGCPESIRGLQLGEEQAPLISPPDSRRPETAYASYSRRLLNAGRGFLQIVARQIFRKYLIHRGKSVVFISWKPFLSTARITRRATRTESRIFFCSRGRWPRLLLAEAGTGDLGVRAGPDPLELCVRCGGLR